MILIPTIKINPLPSSPFTPPAASSSPGSLSIYAPGRRTAFYACDLHELIDYAKSELKCKPVQPKPVFNALLFTAGVLLLPLLVLPLLVLSRSLISD
ncbi:hypothetical protein L2E82_15693 [Cichorium intybus]|uniref:Uncharacterized protein n=1 Tax=Cichorium intybus TaxID=13427 RepID=A0ACB9F3G9_CICIN|nr:hypothetical protein L2E82_15693 [Cichorium intybus]